MSKPKDEKCNKIETVGLGLKNIMNIETRFNALLFFLFHKFEVLYCSALRCHYWPQFKDFNVRNK